MGLQNRTSTGVYVKLKDGKFYLSKDESNTPFDELEGTLVDMYFKDETYEGTVQRKLYIVMNDADQNLIINFRFDSRYTSDFIKFLKNVDLKEPFTICPVSKDKVNAKGETVKENGILLKQDGTFIKSYYSKDHPNGLPQMRQVKVSGKTVWDKTDMLEFFENVVEKEIKPQLPKRTAPKTIVQDEEAPEDLPETKEEEVDKLPWED